MTTHNANESTARHDTATAAGQNLTFPANQTAALSEAERTMLTYALDEAQKHIWSRDGFTDEDQAAVDSLRRLTAVPVPPPADQTALEAERDSLGREADRLRKDWVEMRTRAERAEARATAMEHAMESTAADALKHRGCHRELMAQCLRAERAEAEAALLRRLAAEAQQPEPGPCVAGEQQNETPEATLAAALDGLHTLIATSSRDWGQYRVDAWLWAVLCGWDCEEGHEHDELCDDGAAMREMAAMHGWDDDTAAKARRYRAAVRALTKPAAGVRQDGAQAGDVTGRLRDTTVHLHQWDGTRNPATEQWLTGTPHTWDGDQLAIHNPDDRTEGAELRPQPGWTLVRWPDGAVTVTSPRSAVRLFDTGTDTPPLLFWDREAGVSSGEGRITIPVRRAVDFVRSVPAGDLILQPPAARALRAALFRAAETALAPCCPFCSENMFGYGEDDFVYLKGSDLPYCSHECVIAAYRAGLKEKS